MDVSAQLEKAKAQYKPITVDRLVPPTLDLGHLAIFDPNPLDSAPVSGDALEQYLHSISRDSAQLLYNAVFSLETTSNDDGVFVELPSPVVALPREKMLPKDTPLTKWERFAREKGIQKRKRTRMVFDEATGEYRPRWGYGSAKNDKRNDWLLPASAADPYADVFAEQRDAKRERIAKNQRQQQRNTAVAGAVERGEDPRAARKRELEQRLRASKRATASAGVFDAPLTGDIKARGVKRQFAPTVGDLAGERAREHEVAAKVLQKSATTVVDARKAANMAQMAEEARNRSAGAAAGKKRGAAPRRGAAKKRRTA